jgi:hypothetical protein
MNRRLWVGPRAYLDNLEKSLLLLPGIEPNYSVYINGWKEVEGLCVKQFSMHRSSLRQLDMPDVAYLTYTIFFGGVGKLQYGQNPLYCVFRKFPE